MLHACSACVIVGPAVPVCFFFFNDTATTEIYTLSLHDALPILPASPCTAKSASYSASVCMNRSDIVVRLVKPSGLAAKLTDRKSTRLNSSHGYISYAVFCLKKKKGRSLCSAD